MTLSYLVTEGEDGQVESADYTVLLTDS